MRTPHHTTCANILRSGVLRIPPSIAGVARPQSSLFTYPGLCAKPFWTLDELEERGVRGLRRLQANVDLVREEFVRLKEECVPSDFDDGEKSHDGGLHNGKWEWHSFIQHGKRCSMMSKRCAETWRLLEGIGPHLMLGTPFSFSFYSSLSPAATIAPHAAPCNLRLRVHLPLFVPTDGDCALEVGGERRRWVDGKLLIFDDSFVHAAWNRAKHDRTVLLLDLWHPDLTDGEICAVQDMFQEARDAGWLGK